MKQLTFKSILTGFAVLVLILLFGSVGRPVMAEGCKPIKWTDAEQYVIDQLEIGEPVKLVQKYSREEDRTLSNCFMMQLLTDAGDKFKIGPHGVVIDGAVITGDVDLAGRPVNQQVKLTNCRFQGKVDFTDCIFSKSLLFVDSIFDGPVDFEDMTIGINFAISACHFRSKTETFLKTVRVGGDWLMSNADFVARVDFTQTEIQGNLLADTVTFAGGADFDTVRTKDDCSLRKAVFGDKVSFNEAQFSNLFLTNSTFTRSSDPKTDVDLTGLTVNSCYLDDAVFGDARITIDRMSFQYLSPASWDKLQRLARDQPNSEFYSTLGAMLLSHGYPDQAKQAFFAQKKAERVDMLRRNAWAGGKLNWVNARLWWVVDELRDSLVGYGKSLQLLLVWSVVLFLPGYIIFRTEDGMKTKKPEDKATYANKYNGFWYALDLFLPIISLSDAKVWTPKDERRWALHYRRVHILIGNLLIPIGLAAWTGIIQ